MLCGCVVPSSQFNVANSVVPNTKAIKLREVSPPIQTISAPPDIHNYDFIDNDIIVLHSYTDDLNWYLFYLFSYAHIVNKYAISKGYTPPKVEPICKVFKWPKFLPVPKLEYNGNVSMDDVELELALFISKARVAYEGQRRRFEDAEMWQRRLCIY